MAPPQGESCGTLALIIGGGGIIFGILIVSNHRLKRKRFEVGDELSWSSGGNYSFLEFFLNILERESATA